MPAYVVVTGEKTRDAAELEQYKQLRAAQLQRTSSNLSGHSRPHRGG
jgi:hypothetical protein